MITCYFVTRFRYLPSLLLALRFDDYDAMLPLTIDLVLALTPFMTLPSSLLSLMLIF